jgi:hypothetical protein
LRFAPIVRLSPAGDQILLASQWFVDDAGRTTPGSDHWLASFNGRSIGVLADADATTRHPCGEFDSGFIGGEPSSDGAVYYSACWSPADALTVDRIAVDGRLVSTTEFPGSLGGIDSGTRVSPSGDAFYSWNPFETVLSRLDLRSGELNVGQPQRPNPTGLTTPLGDRLIVVSADGTRVYTPRDRVTGRWLESPPASTRSTPHPCPLGHWAPRASSTSIAVSDDGRHVYAAADGGPSAAGDPAPEFGARSGLRHLRRLGRRHRQSTPAARDLSLGNISAAELVSSAQA